MACSRIAPQEPPRPAPPPLEYLAAWGTKGDGPGQLSGPVGLAVDFAGRVYLADAGSGFVHKFDPGGTPLLSFQGPALRSPDGITVDRGGAIYVADPVRGRIIVFDPEGTRLREIRCAPRRSPQQAFGISVDDDGNLFVVDAGRNRIQKFNARGRLLKAWGEQVRDSREVKSPVSAAIGPDGFLYVARAGPSPVEKFTRDGELVAAFSAPEPPAATALIAGLAVSEKYIFAADLETHRIHVWTLAGEYKLTDDLGGRLNSAANNPISMAVSTRGELLVLDPVAPQVLRFRINF